MLLHNLLQPTYKDKDLNQKIRIYKKTKKKRIKNKLFKVIILLATKEKPVVEYKGAVLMNIKMWDAINNEIKDLEERIVELSKLVSENDR